MCDRRNEREGGIGGRNKRGEEKDRGRRGGEVDGGGEGGQGGDTWRIQEAEY